MFGYTGAQVGLMLNYNAVVLFSSHEILVSINNCHIENFIVWLMDSTNGWAKIPFSKLSSC